MGLDIALHMPPGRFVRVALNGETVLHEGDRHSPAKGLSRLFRDQADVSLVRDMTNEELREVADAIAAVEYDPSFADEYYFIDDREDFQRKVALFEAYAAAGGTMTASY